jgi:hypothetical protein
MLFNDDAIGFALLSSSYVYGIAVFANAASDNVHSGNGANRPWKIGAARDCLLKVIARRVYRRPVADRPAARTALARMTSAGPNANRDALQRQSASAGGLHCPLPMATAICHCGSR